MSIGPLPFILQALATFAGAVFVLIGIWYKDRLENERNSRNAKVQIFAEMRALLDLIELNEYLPAIERTIGAIKAGERAHIYFPTNRSFTSVYEANLSNLGLLGDQASEVVRFYMILSSAIEDKDTISGIMRQIRELEDARKAVDPILLSRLLSFHEVLYAKISSAVKIGNCLLREDASVDPEAGKVSGGNRAAAFAQLDHVEQPLDEGLVGVNRTQVRGPHQGV